MFGKPKEQEQLTEPIVSISGTLKLQSRGSEESDRSPNPSSSSTPEPSNSNLVNPSEGNLTGLPNPPPNPPTRTIATALAPRNDSYIKIFIEVLKLKGNGDNYQLWKMKVVGATTIQEEEGLIAAAPHYC